MTKAYMLGGPFDGQYQAVQNRGPIYFQRIKWGAIHDIEPQNPELQTETDEYLPSGTEIFLHNPLQHRDDTGEAVAFQEYPYSSTPRECDRCNDFVYAGLAIRQADGSFEQVCLRCLAIAETARRQMRKRIG